MLSSIHVSPPATTPASAAAPGAGTATIERSGLPRTPRRLLGARTLEELRELLATVLRGLYHDEIRFELYVADTRGELFPVAERRALAASHSRRLGSAPSFVTMDPELASPRALPLPRLVPRDSMMSAPLVDCADELIGLVVVEAPPGAPAFTRLQADVLEGIAALVSVAVLRLRASEPDRARARLELDRRAARGVQRGLMSGSLPPGIGVTAYTEYLPSLDVGGDFYGLRHLGDGKVAAAIGDVSGNGVSAALLMSRVAADIERALAAGEAPSAVLGAVNDALSNVESESFVTASCLRLDTRTRRVTVANAGHLPLVVRRAGGRVFTCGAASGMPLGMLPCEYQDEELTLEAKDIVLLVTDGLLEALDHPSGQMGMDLLLSLVRDGPHDARILHARVRAAVAEARSRVPLDDVTWVALQIAD